MLFMIMPLVFVFVIARFPAGLVLYWVTTNLWTVGQGLITRRLMPKTPAPAARAAQLADAAEGRRRRAATAPGARSRRPKPAAAARQRRAQVRRKKKAGGRR